MAYPPLGLASSRLSTAASYTSIFDPSDDVVSSKDFLYTRRPSLAPTFADLKSNLEAKTARSGPPPKDVAIELLARKIRQMEAKLNSQLAAMVQLKDENVSLKERYAKDLGDYDLAFSRDCRTVPSTPMETAVKVALGVLGEAEHVYEPNPETVARILSQTFSYSLVLPQDYRALTWTLAHRTQRSAQEGHALKFAVNFLISKVHQLQGQPLETVVHDVILAELIGLSQTANGNYLVQQLIECGGTRARIDVYEGIREHLLKLSNDKYGTHVVCKCAEYAELRAALIPDLVKLGVAETFQTGARRLWKAIFDASKKNSEFDVFELVTQHMRGRWADCATSTENGTISVQQVFEAWPSIASMQPVLHEITTSIARIANGGWGHFLISKLLSNPSTGLRPQILVALLESPSPVAIGHHGISFLRTALLELGRPGIEAYVESLCSSSARRDGHHTPLIVEVAGAVVGPGHVSFLWTMLTPAEKNRLKEACRSHIVSIRGSQSGNDLLRQLGLMPSNVVPKLR